MRCRAVGSLCLAWLLAGPAGDARARAGDLRIDFLDVGQGDAALVTSPTGKTLLVDGGPPEMAARLGARLARLGRPLDLVLLSHRHIDHLGGLAHVIDAVGARAFVDAPFPHPSPSYTALLDALERRHVAVSTAAAGRSFDLGGGATLTLLGPPDPPIMHTRSDVNTNSVVARLDYGALSVLFVGDVEAPGESWLLEHRRPLLRAKVIKVAHHGSPYSSTPEFIAAVHAEVAVVSVGAHNDHGHPSSETLERWEAAGARVYRTDRDGEISIVSDGRRLVVSATHPAAAPLAHRRAASYVASRRSHVFHRAGCAGAATIAAVNLIHFADRPSALATHRRPARDCLP